MPVCHLGLASTNEPSRQPEAGWYVRECLCLWLLWYFIRVGMSKQMTEHVSNDVLHSLCMCCTSQPKLRGRQQMQHLPALRH
jgi:hypothetical protein